MRDRVAPRTRWPHVLLRAALMAGVAASLVGGLVGGLLRAGATLPLPDGAAWAGHAVLDHAFLMVCGFLGTVIGTERAVALKAPAAFAVPAAAATSGLLALGGQAGAAAGLGALAALVFVAVNAVLLARQPAEHTRLLLIAAAAWFAGGLLHALGATATAVVPWWFAFLVLTIAAERLEMTRLMRRRRGAATALRAVLGALLVGAALSAVSARWGGALYGAALTALAVWLMRHDIARRTIASHGLSRYMAVCLLLGYAWLAIAGVAWAATAVGLPARDIALHALGLGFVVGMIFGHAPVILPALTGVKVLFGGVFYLPLALLQLSLALRLFAGGADARLLASAAAANAAALAAFALTMAGAALAWRARHDNDSRTRDAHPAHD